MTWMLGPFRESIITILMVAGPIVLFTAVAGLVLGVIQAATQIQDQAIPSAVKLVGIMLLIIFLGAWMFNYLSNFTEKTFSKAFSAPIEQRSPVLDAEEFNPRGNNPAAQTYNPNDNSDPNLPNLAPLTTPEYPELNSNYSGSPYSQTYSSPNSNIPNPAQSFSDAARPPQKPSSYPYQGNTSIVPQYSPPSQYPDYQSNYRNNNPNNYPNNNQNPNYPLPSQMSGNPANYNNQLSNSAPASLNNNETYIPVAKKPKITKKASTNNSTPSSNTDETANNKVILKKQNSNNTEEPETISSLALKPPKPVLPNYNNSKPAPENNLENHTGDTLNTPNNSNWW